MARLGLAAAAPGYSYRGACHDWLEHEEASKWPGVVRFGNVLLLGLLYRLFRRNSYYIPSAVSALSGIGTIWLSWLLDGNASLWAALVIAVSPLQLHLGRRALQDQAVCCLTLAGLYAGLSGHLAVATVVMAALVAVKETTALHMLAIAAAWVVSGIDPVAALVTVAAASALYFLAFCVITREPLLLWRLARRLIQARHDSYGTEHQQGAFHRLAVDLFLLSPVAVLIAVRSDSWTPVAAFVVALLAVQSLTPILRSVRMVTAADASLRAMIASTVSPLAACVVAATDMYIFWRVFQRGEVYDPVTLNLVTALGFSPKRIS